MVGITRHARQARATGRWPPTAGIFTFPTPALHFYGSIGNKTLNKPIVGIVPAPNPGGYWMVGKDGGVFAFGAAAFAPKGSLPALGITTNDVVGFAAA